MRVVVLVTVIVLVVVLAFATAIARVEPFFDDDPYMKSMDDAVAYSYNNNMPYDVWKHADTVLTIYRNAVEGKKLDGRYPHIDTRIWAYHTIARIVIYGWRPTRIYEFVGWDGTPPRPNWKRRFLAVLRGERYEWSRWQDAYNDRLIDMCNELYQSLGSEYEASEAVSELERLEASYKKMPEDARPPWCSLVENMVADHKLGPKLRVLEKSNCYEERSDYTPPVIDKPPVIYTPTPRQK